MTEKVEKSEKHESKVREYEVEFVMKDKSSKQKFNTSQEIYLLYVHCSKVFQCGLFSLYFNGINLNFIDKNTKLSTIFKKDTKNPRIIVMVKDNQLIKKKNNFEIPINKTSKNTCIKIDKGTLSENLSEISNNEYIDEITLIDEKIEDNEIPCFFGQIANKNINKLAINSKFLSTIDSFFYQDNNNDEEMLIKEQKDSPNLQCFNNLKELELYGTRRAAHEIKKLVLEIKNISFPNLKKLKLVNISVKFSKKNFNILEKLELNNSYLNLEGKESKENIPIYFNSLSFLGLNFVYYTELNEQLDFIMKRTKMLDILKLKLDSIEFNTPFNFTEFCYSNQKNIEKVKNIELNLKSKFIFEEPNIKEKKKCVDKFLRKTIKLKLTPFSEFKEKELSYFGDKLSNINLLKLELLDVDKEKDLIKFLDNYPDLEYISLDEKYNYLIPSKIYKLNIHSIDDITKNKFLNVIASEARRMAKLVTDLLSLSRYDNNTVKVEKTEFDLGELVKKCQEKLEIEISKKHHKVENLVTANVPLVYADKSGIERVVLNILTNSIKYTKENGSIKIYVGFVYNDAYIKIIDNGMGIPEADLNRIYERFYRVDKARTREMGGTGLGLPIAKEIIEANGGSIDINSDIGKGTEVIIKVPLEKLEVKNG